MNNEYNDYTTYIEDKKTNYTHKKFDKSYFIDKMMEDTTYINKQQWKIPSFLFKIKDIKRDKIQQQKREKT